MTAGQPPCRLGFLGVGWIGRHRMLAVHRSGLATVAAVADADPAVAEKAAAEVGAPAVRPEALLDGGLGLDGVVIATPSALHADQAITALDAGLAVFCQKPLGRTAEECAAVVAAARRADRLLGVDLSYRHLRAVEAMHELVVSGGIGDVFAVDLVFHNAYGPDKAWFRDRALAGGGCVIDLGIHLVDLALWMLGGPKVETVEARLFAGGRPLPAEPDVVEDHAVARLDLASGAVVNLACSWFLHAGCDAVISAAFHGTTGGVSLRNVGGSFYDFRADLHRGTTAEALAVPPDDWGGRAAVAWAQRLAAGDRFDPAVEDIVAVARVLDRIYGR
jgi:predicted dehydrogenase